MTTRNPEQSHEQFLQGLLEQARRLWGERRAEELQASLESTATQLRHLAEHLPDQDVEPGFYP